MLMMPYDEEVNEVVCSVYIFLGVRDTSFH